MQEFDSLVCPPTHIPVPGMYFVVDIGDGPIKLCHSFNEAAEYIKQEHGQGYITIFDDKGTMLVCYKYQTEDGCFTAKF